ncbi:MAG: class II fructose-bisphosphate aldolase [Lachnospiraceae bacterium]|nr:class II fructose-bisphosphate aldolase [Lachnospiraceae bacterium]
MLVTLKEILKIAEEKDYGVGAFNTPNLECLTAVLQSAEKYKVPVIIAHAELHESVQPLSVIGPVMIQKAKEAKVPVCVHLDHGEHLDYLEQALELGFTSIMYDGSSLSYEENVANTKQAVAMAKKKSASVEAEIGVLGGRETAGTASVDPESMYTDPALAEKFVKETGIDALACSFGTAHGIYKTIPKLDFPRIAKIKELVKIPLVMHGGSGCSENDYIQAISNGVRKINYYSYMSREGVFAVKDMLGKQEVTFFHDLAAAAQQAMQKDVERAMKIFYGL